VSIIGKGDEQVGYFGAMCVLGLTGVVLLYVCFFTTKERYTFEVQPGSSVAKDLKLLLGNGQWRIMCAFKMMATCSNVVRGGATLYFVKYVMDHPEMATQFYSTAASPPCLARSAPPDCWAASTASPPSSGSSSPTR
jgi:Na+/melibiose symporter-like transporter